MNSDPDFQRQWAMLTKSLFDIEDENNNKVLERAEFDRFIIATMSATLNPTKVSIETTREKLDNTWNAMTAVGQDPNIVTWNDYMYISQIIDIWTQGGLLMWELEY